MSTISDLAKATAYKLAAEVETSSPSKALLPESVVAASPIIPSLATLGYVQTAMRPGRNAKGNNLSSKEIDKFEDFWRKSDAARGGEGFDDIGRATWRSGLGPAGSRDMIEGTPILSSKQLPPHYNPQTRQVVINPNWAKSKDGALGILAHELGHAEQFRDAHGRSENFKRLFGKFNQLRGGKILGSLGTLAGTGGAYWSDDRNTAFNSALAGSASNIPTLALEAGASARGSRTLVDYAKQTGIWKNKNALQKLKYAGRSWVGVPTYLMAASVPLVVYLARRAGGQLPDKKAVLPEKKAFAPDTSFADGYDEAQLREALVERVRMIAQLRAHRDALLDDKSGYKKADDCHCYPGGPADPDKKGCKNPDCDHCGKATKKAFTTPSATPAPKMSPGYKPTPPRGGNLSMGRVAYNTKPPATSPAPAGGQLPSWVKKQYQDPAKYKFIPSEYANSGRMVNRQTGVVEQSYDDPKALQQYLNNIMKKRGSDIQELAKAAASAAWQRKAGKNSKGGLNEKGRKSYERENPGSDLKAPVTGKVKPGGKAAKRRKSFCARMKGNKGPMKKPNGEPTRKALALRKWKC